MDVNNTADIEFMRYYEPGTELWRCGGGKGCGALIVNGDMELHLKWHTRVAAQTFPDLPVSLKRGR